MVTNDRESQITMPKPILELLGNPNSIKYVISGIRIEIKAK